MKNGLFGLALPRSLIVNGDLLCEVFKRSRESNYFPGFLGGLAGGFSAAGLFVALGALGIEHHAGMFTVFPLPIRFFLAEYSWTAPAAASTPR